MGLRSSFRFQRLATSAASMVCSASANTGMTSLPFFNGSVKQGGLDYFAATLLNVSLSAASAWLARLEALLANGSWLPSQSSPFLMVSAIPQACLGLIISVDL